MTTSLATAAAIAAHTSGSGKISPVALLVVLGVCLLGWTVATAIFRIRGNKFRDWDWEDMLFLGLIGYLLGMLALLLVGLLLGFLGFYYR